MNKLLKAAAACSALALGMLGTVAAPNADAAHRKFPEYNLSFQKIVGQKDPNFNPETDEGDGCIRSENPEVVHLSTFAFHASINQCDAVRTTVEFYLPDGDGAPTLEFRFGTTWQYTRVSDSNPNDYIPKPVENFLYDGKPVSKDKYDPQNAIVKDSAGNLVRMNRGRGYYEPIHFRFEDTFGPGEKHVIQYDSYLPANADWGGLTWGTGSTGDTQGGSIGAKANGLKVDIPVKADFRYVLDSEYRQVRGLDAQESGDEKTGVAYDPRRRAGWGGKVEGSNYEIIQCLEGQQLADEASSIPINKIYPEVNSDQPVDIEGPNGSYLLSGWLYEFYSNYAGTQNFDSMAGRRTLNLNNGEFKPYMDEAGNISKFPYKPTLESVIKDIPGYRYVGHDIQKMPDGAIQAADNSLGFERTAGFNIRGSYHRTNINTQHFYLTYEPIPGTFQLNKRGDKGEAISGAKFELYEEVAERTSACGRISSYPDAQTVNVCPSDAQGGENCERNVRKVKLAGSDDDGRFVTGADGSFKPQDSSLLPGKYLLKEIEAPKPYMIENPWTGFEVPLQKGTSDEEKKLEVPVVEVVNKQTPSPTPTPTPTPTPSEPPTPPATTPPTPGKPGLPITGDSGAVGATLIAAAMAAGAALIVKRRK